MSGRASWRRFWEEVNAAMDRFGTAQSESTGQFIKDVRIAMTKYGEAVDPSSFDELGQPIEEEDA